MAGGKKNALVPPVYNAQTTRKSDGNGVATFVSPLVYAQKPDKLSSDINHDVKIKGFKILKLGDGIEVGESNFAAEVAATAGI